MSAALDPSVIEAVHAAGYVLVPASDIATIGALTIDGARHQIRSGARMLRTTPHETTVLLALARGQGSKQHLLHALYGDDEPAYAENIVVLHVHKLRDKLNRLGRPARIATIHGVGYRLEALP